MCFVPFSLQQWLSVDIQIFASWLISLHLVSFSMCVALAISCSTAPPIKQGVSFHSLTAEAGNNTSVSLYKNKPSSCCFFALALTLLEPDSGFESIHMVAKESKKATQMLQLLWNPSPVPARHVPGVHCGNCLTSGWRMGTPMLAAEGRLGCSSARSNSCCGFMKTVNWKLGAIKWLDCCIIFY